MVIIKILRRVCELTTNENGNNLSFGSYLVGHFPRKVFRVFFKIAVCKKNNFASIKIIANYVGLVKFTVNSPVIKTSVL